MSISSQNQDIENVIAGRRIRNHRNQVGCDMIQRSDKGRTADGIEDGESTRSAAGRPRGRIGFYGTPRDIIARDIGQQHRFQEVRRRGRGGIGLVFPSRTPRVGVDCVCSVC